MQWRDLPLGEEEIAVLVWSHKGCGPSGGPVEFDGLEGLPDPPAGEGLHTAELPITTGREEVSFSQDGGIHDAMEMGGFAFASLFGAVDDLRFAVICLELEKHGSVVE